MDDKYIDLYIDYLKYERKLSKNTVNSYSDNLDKFMDLGYFLDQQFVDYSNLNDYNCLLMWAPNTMPDI